MTPDEKIALMTKSINEAIKVLEHPFESTKNDVSAVIQGLKNAIAKDIPK